MNTTFAKAALVMALAGGYLGTFSPSMTSAQASGPGFSALLTAVRDVYTQEIYMNAMPNLRFSGFATRRNELGQQAGATIVMPKFGNIKRGGRLTEGVRINTRSISMASSSITVEEVGNAVAMTERLLQTSFYDNMAAASMLLGRDMAIVLDLELRDAARLGTNVIYGGGKGARTELVDGDVMTTKEFHVGSERLETNSSPKLGNDFYVMFAHPHQIASLRQSVGWINAAQYAGVTPIYTGEVGRFNDIRVVQTSVMPNGANSARNAAGDYADPGFDPDLVDGTAGNLTTVYQALLFGEFTYGHAIALPVELRDNGITDFGREHGLAWYAIWGSGLLEDANVVVIETA